MYICDGLVQSAGENSPVSVWQCIPGRERGGEHTSFQQEARAGQQLTVDQIDCDFIVICDFSISYVLLWVGHGAGCWRQSQGKEAKISALVEPKF